MSTSAFPQPSPPSSVPPAIGALLEGVVDYAGLFPPAGLGMTETVARYDAYHRGPYRWMLGHLVLPWSRRVEFLDAVERLDAPPTSPAPWSLSILFPEFDAAALDPVAGAHAEFERRASGCTVGAVELKIGSAGVGTTGSVSETASETLSESFDLLTRLFPEAEIHLEATGAAETAAVLDLVAAQRARTGRGAAKIRTGGVSAPLIPPPAQIAEFILNCTAREIPWKATAGLHHPLPALRALTYEPDAPTGPMHGFLNVLLASAAAVHGVANTPDDLLPILTEPSAPAMTPEGVRWPGIHLAPEAIQLGRTLGCASFGSCSFEEPVHDLEALGFNLAPRNESDA